MPLRLGSTGQLVSDWQRVMLRRFGGYAKEADGSALRVDGYYGYSDAAVQREYQRRTRQPITGVVSDADLIGLGLLARVKPVLFTIEGHMSRWDAGPCAETARTLEAQGVCRWQGVGYNTQALPFDNASGITEFRRLLGDTALLPPGTPWALACFSQGAIIGSSVFMAIRDNPSDPLHYRLADWRGTVAFGNPYRELNVVAPWVPDPPRLNTHGISPFRMTRTPPNWMEHSRRGDMYAEVQAGTEATEHMQAIYLAVMNTWSGHPDSLLSQLIELSQRPQIETVAMFWAIVQGGMFVMNMGPHGMYDLRGPIEFLRARLTAPN